MGLVEKSMPVENTFLFNWNVAELAQVPSDDLAAYYCVCIRSSLDHAFPVFQNALLKGVQKRALSCIFLGVSYNNALNLAGIDIMRAHHEQITNQLFQSVVNNSSNKIHGLLPVQQASL